MTSSNDRNQFTFQPPPSGLSTANTQKQNKMSHPSCNASPPTNKTQYYAFVFTQRRLLPLVVLPAMLNLVVPRSFSKILLSFDGLTEGWALTVMFTTFCGCREIYKRVKSFAPTPEKYELAMNQCRYRLPLMVLLVVVFSFKLLLLFCRKIAGAIIAGGEETNQRFQWMNVIFSFSVAKLVNSWMKSIGTFWISLGTLVLSWMVVMRYAGRGIAQCSQFLLPSNPTYSVRTAILDFVGFRSIIHSTKPPQNPNSAELLSHNCTTFQNPTMRKIAIQVIFHAVGGCLYYFASIPTIDRNLITLASCVILSIATLLTTHVFKINSMTTQPPHEISITNYKDQKANASWIFQHVQRDLAKKLKQSKLLFVWAFTPIFLLATMLVKNKMDGHDDTILFGEKMIVLLFFSTYPKTLFVMIYTLSLDIMVRMVLVVKGLNVDQLLAHAKKDMTSATSAQEECTPDDLIVQSILAGLGTSLVEDVTATHSRGKGKQQSRPLKGDVGPANLFGGNVAYGRDSHAWDLEEEENRRNDLSMSRVADMVMTGLPSTFTLLEVGLFRIMLLESLGGSDGDVEESVMSIKKKKSPFGLSSRHYQTIKNRLKEPTVASVVRALCAYSGGIGEALIRCTAKNDTKWSFPSGTSVSVEYAILGSARLVALSFLPDLERKPLKINLSILVPIVIQSIFRVRCGLLAYMQYLMDMDGAVKKTSLPSQYSSNFHQSPQHQIAALSLKKDFNSAVVHFPDLHSIFKSCDIGAMMIMQTYTCPLDEIQMNSKCKEWLREL